MRRHHEEITMLVPVIMSGAAATGAFVKAWLATRGGDKAPQPPKGKDGDPQG